jgi:acyl-CoA reductase-like NAD-dependent aldehyde dehydrogenase
MAVVQDAVLNTGAELPPGASAGSLGPNIQISNPRTGEALYVLTQAGEEAISQAYSRARAAAPQLAAMTVKQRMAELTKLHDYIRDHREEIVERIVAECGKTRTEGMLTEIFPVLDLIQHYQKTAHKVLRDEKVPTPMVLFGKKSRVYYEPLGTVLIISPWNYPFNLSLCPIVTAVAAGNTVVFKPSEHTPLQGLLEEIIKRSGFMKEAVQVVYGGREVGRRCIDHRPSKVFFTGSEAAGKAIMRQCSEHLTPVELELGGKDPMIVFADANLNRSVNGALWGCMTNSGQTCVSVERIYVEAPLYDDFVTQLKEDVERITTSGNREHDFDDRDIDMGCMTAEFQVEKLEDQVHDAVAKGATLIAGGRRKPGTRHFEPTLITGVTPEMKIYYEESFGPVATVMPFTTEEEAIRLANDSPYGLCASVWSGDAARADRVARAIVTGGVNINNVITTQGNAALPFGGAKSSGMGRYKGPHGLYSFCNIKAVMIDRNSGRYEPIWYPYTRKKYDLVSKLVEHAFSPGLLHRLRMMLIGLRLELLEKKRHF